MRQSGILMHITSLPGAYGIGTMGRAAYEFVDFLVQAGQRVWQILPLNPTGYGDSPYQSPSSYAGNPYLIDLELLVEEGLLKPEEPEGFFWGSDPGRVDFGVMYQNRLRVLELAWRRFRPEEAYGRFVEENREWLEDYCLYAALKEHYGTPWYQWSQGLATRDPADVDFAREAHGERIQFHRFLQYLFHRQWNALRRYANERNIRIVGDVPIYVPLDSADVWANPELFQLDEHRNPTAVAGCPPDGFSTDGQLWGNPLYRWETHRSTGYRWWLDRLGAAAQRYDVVRLDHFRGFESYWAIPAGDATAAGGAWVKGPGADFVRAVQQGLPDLKFIAEDLGYLTQEVKELQALSGYPGMKIMEFAFDSRESGDYLPHCYPVNSVCYTGTHDNVTLKQWLEEAAAEDIAQAEAYLGLNDREGYLRGMIRGGMASVSRLFVAQMQDWLELGKEARMNQPGTLTSANWTWRAESGFDSPALASRIRAMTELFGRI